MNRIYITKIGYLNGDGCSCVIPAGFYDSDGDGNDELYFSISSCFPAWTQKNVLFRSGTQESEIQSVFRINCLDPEMADTDGDNQT